MVHGQTDCGLVIRRRVRLASVAVKDGWRLLQVQLVMLLLLMLMLVVKVVVVVLQLVLVEVEAGARDKRRPARLTGACALQATCGVCGHAFCEHLLLVLDQGRLLLMPLLLA